MKHWTKRHPAIAESPNPIYSTINGLTTTFRHDLDPGALLYETEKALTYLKRNERHLQESSTSQPCWIWKRTTTYRLGWKFLDVDGNTEWIKFKLKTVPGIPPPPPNFRETINTVRHIVPGQVIANYTELSQNRSRSLELLSNKSQPLQILLLCLPGASG